MPTYGLAIDATDEYCMLGESTTMEALKHFAIGVQTWFKSTYLRTPTLADLMKQLIINDARGFSGMFASVNCMHYQWKNYPIAWQGQFQDKDRHKNIILEAIIDPSLWIWHVFFGLLGGNNHITVLNRSPLVTDMLRGEPMGPNFLMNGFVYPIYYFFADESTLDGHVLCR
jgi:hypothetical protein